MNENQFLEIIDGKIDVVKNLVEQQSKSGMFFDGFTKQVLEKINDKLDNIAGMETNELITYLTKELKNSFEEKHLVIQERMDGVQGQISAIQANLADSLKSPEIAAIFTKLSDTVLDFSRNLNSQSKYFNSTIEDIQRELAKNNVDEKFVTQTNSIRMDIERYKIDVASVVDSVNSNFAEMKEVIESNKPSEAYAALAMDISLLQKGLNDVLSVVAIVEDKQTDFVTAIKDIAANISVEEIKMGVSSIFAEMQALREAVKYLSNKADTELLNEKLSSVFNSLIELKGISASKNNENQSLLKKYFDEIHEEFSSLLTKEESEVLKNKLEYIQSKLVAGDENIQDEIKNLTATINLLLTKENAKDLLDSWILGANNLTNRLEEYIAKELANTEEKINSVKELLTNINKELENISTKVSDDKILVIQSEIKQIISDIPTHLEKNTEKTTSSIEEIKNSIESSILSMVDKIEHLETFTNFVQDKNEEQKNDLLELKDYLQKLVTIISPINLEINLKTEDLKQSIGLLQNDFKEKTQNIKEDIIRVSGDICQTITKQEDSIKNIESKLDLTNESTANGIKITENLNSAVDALDKKINNLCLSQESITEQVSDVVSHQENIIRELETKVLLVADSTVENIKIIDEMNASVGNLDKKIEELSNVCTNVTSQITNVCEKQSNIIEDVESKVAIVTNSIVEKAQDEIDEKLNLITNTCGLINSQMEEVVTQREEIVKNIESKVVLVADTVVANGQTVSKFDEILNKIDNKISSADEQRKTTKEDILAKISEVMTALGEKLTQSFTQRNTIKNEIIDTVKTVNNDISEQITANTEKVNSFTEEITQLLGTSFANVSEKLSLENAKNDEFKENLKIELEKTISEIINKLLKADEENISTREQLIQILDSAVKNIKENNQEQFEEIKGQFIQNQEEIVKNIIEEINLDELKIDICQDISLYTVSLKEKLETLNKLVFDNKTEIEKMSAEKSSELMGRIAEIKEELNEIKLSNASSLVVTEIKRVGEKIEGWSNDILDSISDEMKDASANNIKIISEAVQDSVALIKDDIQELVIRLADVNGLAQEVKNAVGDSLDTYLEEYNAKFDDLTTDIKNHVELNTEKLTNIIQEYQKELKTLSDVDLKLYKEETKQFIEEQIKELKESLENINSKIESENLDTLIKENTSEEIKEIINSSTESINKRLELLRDILLSEIPSNDLISNGFDEVQDTLTELNEKTDKLSNMQTTLDEINTKADNFANIVKTENASLKDIIDRYQEGISAISNIEISSSSNDTKEFIKEELKNLKEQFIKNLTSVFENVSFIEESEEIQNAIWDNADVIRKEITQLKQDLVSKNNINSNSDIDNKFDKLKNILESITTGDVGASDKYIYTLPDVEMDIAKMRMAISEVSDLIKQNREDGFDVADRLNAVDDIKDDISSISKRTNKLILTSDESNKFLRENINDFKNILTAITKKCNKIDSTQLNQHIIDVKSLVMSGLKSDKILNEAFMHLAQWIDDTAKTMNTISSQVEVNKYTLSAIKTEFEKMENKTNEIDTVKEAISDLATKLDKKSDIDYSKSLYEIEYGLDRISEKMDVQELKIKALEKKIESLSTTQDTSDETNSLLEFIASQVTAANENSRSNRLLLQKVSMLEKQMSRFETSIAKITQFVDDAN